MPSPLPRSFRRPVLTSLVLGVAALAASLAVACGSSSSTRSATPDAGHPEDSGHAVPDAGHTPDGGHSMKKQDAAHDAGFPDTGEDSGVDAGCQLVDADVSGLAVSAACASCVQQNCCTKAITCAMTTGCKEIEECALACVKGGTTGRTCAVYCILNDGGVIDAGTSVPTLNAAQTAAEELDLCFASGCPSVCGG